MRNIVTSLCFALTAYMIGTPARLVAAVVEQDAIGKLADAATPAEHVATANQLRRRAADARAAARRHEQEARRLEDRQLPFERKWPAMSATPMARERRMAAEAWRAAREAALQAEHHWQLATEALAVKVP